MYISIIILHEKEKNKKGNNIVFIRNFVNDLLALRLC